MQLGIQDVEVLHAALLSAMRRASGGVMKCHHRNREPALHPRPDQQLRRYGNWRFMG